MINEPLVDAFFSQQTCHFCDYVMFVNDAQAVLHHFLKRHKGLVNAYFTCLGCIIPTVLHSSEYFRHYDKYHSKALGLMFVLNETNVHVRTQHAHVLYMFLMMAMRLNFKPNNDYDGRSYPPSADGPPTTTLRPWRRRS